MGKILKILGFTGQVKLKALKPHASPHFTLALTDPVLFCPQRFPIVHMLAGTALKRIRPQLSRPGVYGYYMAGKKEYFETVRYTW